MADLSLHIPYVVCGRWDDRRPVCFHSPANKPYLLMYQVADGTIINLGSICAQEAPADRTFAIPSRVLTVAGPRLLSSTGMDVSIGKHLTRVSCESVVCEYPTITPAPYRRLPEGDPNVFVNSEDLASAFSVCDLLGSTQFALSFTSDGVYGGGHFAMFKVPGSSTTQFNVPVPSLQSGLLTDGRWYFEVMLLNDGVLTASTFSTTLPECSQEVPATHLFDRAYMLCTDKIIVSNERVDELRWRVHKAAFITVVLGPEGVFFELHGHNRSDISTRMRISDEPRDTRMFTVPAKALQVKCDLSSAMEVLFAPQQRASDNPPVLVRTSSYELLLTQSQRW